MSIQPTQTSLTEAVIETPGAPEQPEVELAVPEPTTTAKRDPLRLLGVIGLRLLIPAIILLVWWALSTDETIGLFVPAPTAAFVKFYEGFIIGDVAIEHLLPSLQRALIGLALAIVLGIAIGVLLGTSNILKGLFQPLIHLGRSLPSPALLGVFFFLFGTGDLPKIFLITFSVIWPILLNTIDGVGAVGETRAQASRVFRIPTHRVLSHIVLPGAAPKIFAGIRTSMSFSLILMIISELQRSENGLGYLLVQSQRNFDYSTFFAVLIMLVIIGIVFNLIFLAVERRVLAWHRGVTQQND